MIKRSYDANKHGKMHVSVLRKTLPSLWASIEIANFILWEFSMTNCSQNEQWIAAVAKTLQILRQKVVKYENVKDRYCMSFYNHVFPCCHFNLCFHLKIYMPTLYRICRNIKTRIIRMKCTRNTYDFK